MITAIVSRVVTHAGLCQNSYQLALSDISGINKNSYTDNLSDGAKILPAMSTVISAPGSYSLTLQIPLEGLRRNLVIPPTNFGI